MPHRLLALLAIAAADSPLCPVSTDARPRRELAVALGENLTSPAHYLDWPLAAATFALPNYRALESVLLALGRQSGGGSGASGASGGAPARACVLVVGPPASPTSALPEELVEPMFEKFAKLGFDLAFVRVRGASAASAAPLPFAEPGARD